MREKMTNNSNLRKNLSVIKKAFLSIGYSQEETEKQISQLGLIVAFATIERLLKERPECDNLHSQELTLCLKSKYPPETIRKIAKEESGRLVNDFLKTITQALPEEKRQNFFQQIQLVYLS